MDSYNDTSILMVIDDESVAQRLRFPLERRGFKTSVAGNGAAGLAMARARVPDLILLAVHLPVMSGLYTLRNLRSDRLLRHVPVIMVDANGHPSAVVDAIEMGADDHIAEPFDDVDLMERIRTIRAMDNAAMRDDRRGAVLRQLGVGRQSDDMTIETAGTRAPYSLSGSRPS